MVCVVDKASILNSISLFVECSASAKLIVTSVLSVFRFSILFSLCLLFFWAFPSNQIADVGVSASTNLKLVSGEIIFKMFQPICKNVPERWSDRATDRETGGRLTVA